MRSQETAILSFPRMKFPLSAMVACIDRRLAFAPGGWELGDIRSVYFQRYEGKQTMGREYLTSL